MLVLRVFEQQYPCKRRDGIGTCAGGIRDRYTKVLRHACRRSGSGSSHGISACSDELAAGILHSAKRDLVLQRVDELDIADRVWRLLDQTGDAFVALAADADRPVDRRVDADFALP